MRNKYLRIILVLLVLLVTGEISAQGRFPKPEFETGYVQPSPTTPEPRAFAMEYFDVIILIAVLLLISYFIFRRRSRKGILWTSVFSLIYFGFIRNGCICSIGAIQNVSLTLADPNYGMSVVALLFFIIPLVFALFTGRTFCAGACPLGAIQDVVVQKPIQLPVALQRALGMIPYLYLGLAVLYAATGSDFIICRYDPFIGIFRMDAPFTMVVLGLGFLLVGIFVARPYCRFFCPYGVLLNWMSRFSRRHLTITPSKCISCKLCENSCPFDAINIPDQSIQKKDVSRNVKRFLIFALLIPVWMAIGVWVGEQSHVFLSKGNPQVYMAELLISHPELKSDIDNLDIQAFLASGKSMDILVEEASLIRDKFRIGSWILGAFLGLVFGIKLLNLFVYRKSEDYEPDKGECLSCGRCMEYCPVES